MGRLACALLALAGLAAPVRGQEDVQALYLREAGLQPTAESLRAYLRGLDPGEEARQRIASLIEALGSPDAGRRAAATRALAALGAAPRAALRAAVESDDPEVQRRAANLLERSEQMVRSSLLFAVLKTIEEHGIRGLTREVLLAIDVTDEGHVKVAAKDALRVTAGPDDVPLLRRAIRSGSEMARAAAVNALAAVLGNEANEELAALLRDDSEEVRLAAARALADHGDRASLAPLVSLLGARFSSVRYRAAEILAQVAGSRFGYSAFDDAAQRDLAIARWRTWLADEGARARWATPLGSGEEGTLGRTLVADYGRNIVYELDAAGRRVWKIDAQSPWACVGLPNGHRLITLYTAKEVVEYDQAGNEVWRSGELPGMPTSVQRTADGHTILAFGNHPGTIVELGQDGARVWELALEGQPMDAQRLANGRTLVTLQQGGRVVEVDGTGKVCWRLDGLHRPYSSRRLENGNTLVCEVGAKRVAEFDRDGKIVREIRTAQNCCVAQALPGGTIVFADGTGIHEVMSDGTRVSDIDGKDWIWFHRY